MRNSTKALCATGLFCALAASAPQGAPIDNADQHAAAAARPAAPVTSAVTTADLSAMMSRMQDMHRRLAAAKEPAEKQALMVEHFKLIQEGVTTLQQLQARSNSAATTERMLQQRMDMMTMLMRMMVDREPPAGPAADCASGPSATPRK